MLSALGPPHCRTRSFWRWNIGARGSWCASGHSSQHTVWSARWRSPSISSASVAGNGGTVISRPSWSSRATKSCHFLRSAVTSLLSRDRLLGHAEVTLIAAEALPLDGGVEPEIGEGVVVLAVHVLRTAGEVRAHGVGGLGRQRFAERAVQLVDHPDLVLHEVGVVHVVHALGVERAVGRCRGQVVERA